MKILVDTIDAFVATDGTRKLTATRYDGAGVRILEEGFQPLRWNSWIAARVAIMREFGVRCDSIKVANPIAVERGRIRRGCGG
jgi:hypothetical protein